MQGFSRALFNLSDAQAVATARFFIWWPPQPCRAVVVVAMTDLAFLISVASHRGGGRVVVLRRHPLRGVAALHG